MEDYPRNLIEFEKQFSAEADCIQYLFRLRWPKGFICPRCKSSKGWFTERGLCKCTKCAYQASVKAGTIFERSRLPLAIWFRAIWWVTSQKNGASAKGLQRILGLGSYETAWTWLHKLRRAMVRPGRDQLSGTIELDETFIGVRKSGKRGRGAEGKTLVFIAAQIDGDRIGRIRLRRIKDASGASLDTAVQETIAPGSVVRTDGWPGYNNLEHLGYARQIIRKEAVVGENLLPYCNRVASLLKRWLLGTHQGAVSHEHLEYYLDEYTFRFNRRTSRYRGKLFYRLIQQAVEIEPVTYSELIERARKQ